MNKSPKMVVSNVKKILIYIYRPEFLAASLVGATVIVVTINTSGVILRNYRLERDVKVMEQKVSLAKIELETMSARNQYYKTDYYLDIAARKLLSKGLPGEKMIIVPREVALKELDLQNKPVEDLNTDSQNPANYTNSQLWLRFINGEL